MREPNTYPPGRGHGAQKGFADLGRLQQVERWLHNFYVGPNKVTLSPEGASVPAPGGTKSVWCQVTAAGTGKGPHTVSVWTGGYYDSDGVVRSADLTGETAYSPGLAAGQTLLTGAVYLAFFVNGHYELLPEVIH